MDERVEWITDEGRWAALAAGWEGLVADSIDPFADHTWLDCWWRAFGEGSRLSTCVAWRGDELVAALPLHARRGRLAALANVHTPLFHPPAVDEEARLTVLRAALDHPAGELCLEAVPTREAWTQALLAAARERGRKVLVEPLHTSPIAHLADREAWQRAVGPRLREPRRRSRKLAREHETSFDLGEPEDLDGDLDRGFALEAGGWKGAEGTAIDSNARTRAFYRELAAAYHARGELRMGWLHVDGHPAAFSLCLLRAGRLHQLKSGIDDSLRRLSPGIVLRLETIERCFELGYEAYELLGADVPSKRQFADDEREHARVWIYRRRPVALARHAYRRRLRPRLAGARDKLRRENRG